jgi:hypothetical protein
LSSSTPLLGTSICWWRSRWLSNLPRVGSLHPCGCLAGPRLGDGVGPSNSLAIYIRIVELVLELLLPILHLCPNNSFGVSESECPAGFTSFFNYFEWSHSACPALPSRVHSNVWPGKQRPRLALRWRSSRGVHSESEWSLFSNDTHFVLTLTKGHKRCSF